MGRRQNAIFQPALTCSGHRTFESFPWLQAPLPPLCAGRAPTPVTPLETGHKGTARMTGQRGGCPPCGTPRPFSHCPRCMRSWCWGEQVGNKPLHSTLPLGSHCPCLGVLWHMAEGQAAAGTKSGCTWDSETVLCAGAPRGSL